MPLEAPVMTTTCSRNGSNRTFIGHLASPGR
jgi:hypothetical protein